jgi:hypothetical protein
MATGTRERFLCSHHPDSFVIGTKKYFFKGKGGWSEKQIWRFVELYLYWPYVFMTWEAKRNNSVASVRERTLPTEPTAACQRS